ncbi:glycosyltransferase family 2 protein [Salinimonas marina]|uniref:Glycosyltransferase family 2 protein n=1 Tax=Salinimonas marina TaxID=2785918 RepID=A0A7S9DYN9_9ALTE|nr:glycosyltransferase family A protein [Salinimonas marina]QPG06399.1 glycosyltransferase family 2 protein [Salinimonas marina]
MCLVSTIIPTHNRSEWLCDAIESVLAQTYTDIELIVVDDGSTEDIRGNINKRFPNNSFLFARNEVTTSPGSARNRGAALAQGKYLAFLDSDDLWLPDKLEKQVALLEQHSAEGAALAGGACRYMTSDGKPTLRPSFPPASAGYEDFICRIKMPGSGSNNLILKAAFDEVGGFREDLQRAEDKQLWLKLLKRYSVVYVPDITAVIRIHNNARVNVDETVVVCNRLAVDNEIEDSNLRRKAIAFTYFVMFNRLWGKEKWLAAKYLLKSFCKYPFKIEPSANRLSAIKDKLLHS